jgi:hypothetical protein
MKKRRSTLASVLCAASLTFAITSGHAQRSDRIGKDRPTLRIVGSIIGFDAYSHLINQPESVAYEILLVRVDRILAGKENAKYIRVQYTYGPGEPALPSQIFDGGRQWRLLLSRDANYDLPLRELLYNGARDERGKDLPPILRLKRLPGAENEHLPPADTVIPCYAIRPGDPSKAVKLTAQE